MQQSLGPLCRRLRSGTRLGAELRADCADQGPDALPDPVDDVLQHSQIEARLAAEVIPDQRLVRPCGLGDRAGAGGVETVATENIDGGRDQSGPRGLSARHIGRIGRHADYFTQSIN